MRWGRARAVSAPSRPLPIAGQGGFVLYLSLIVLVAVAGFVALVFTAQRLAVAFPTRRLQQLQARVCALSGVEVAKTEARLRWGEGLQASFASARPLGPGSVVTVQSTPRGGWQDVVAQGIHANCTTTVSARLGLKPPAFAQDALTLESCGPTFRIGARARFRGTLASPATEVVSASGGTFQGRLTKPRLCALNDDALNQQIHAVDSTFSRWASGLASLDSLVVGQAHRFADIASSGSRPVLLKGTLDINTGTYGLGERQIWVDGDLILGGDAHVSSGTFQVRGRLRVGASCVVDDCAFVVLGPARINGRAQVSADLLCADTLVVGGAARVHYPSLLFVSPHYARRHERAGQRLVIEDHAQVCGTIVAGAFDRGSLQPRIVIRGGATVEGVVYSHASITLFGRVLGSVYADRAIYLRDRSIEDGCLKECFLTHADVSAMVVPFLFAGARVPVVVRQEESS